MTKTELDAASEQELVARAQQRDQQSLALLYERYYDRVYRYALTRLGNPADAEDLAQETFLKMVDKLGAFRWRGLPFASWLFRIAHNAVIDFARRRAAAGHRVPLQELTLAAKEDPEGLVEQSFSVAELAKAMRGLTQAQQEVLTLRFGAELSVGETAKALGKAEGTVKATQFQALQALRRILSTEGSR